MCIVLTVILVPKPNFSSCVGWKRKVFQFYKICPKLYPFGSVGRKIGGKSEECRCGYHEGEQGGG